MINRPFPHKLRKKGGNMTYPKMPEAGFREKVVTEKCEYIMIISYRVI
jgi:hypothetical protein